MSPKNPKPSGRRVSDPSDLRRRGGGTRSERQVFLIMCEGLTEKRYFKGLCSRTGPKLHVVALPDDHVKTVREAARQVADDYTAVWCVLDTELDSGLVESLRAEARSASVKLALSTPCFELWLILHLAECQRPFQTAKEAKARLKRLLPRWEEGVTTFNDFEAGLPAAMERARRLDPSGEEHLANPSTSVWRLVEEIQAAGH